MNSILDRTVPRAGWLVLGGLAWAVALHGATYYVATNGLDLADGLTAQTPLRTIQRAADRVGPGDTILVREGLYREYLTIPRSGTPAQPIELAGFPGERPLISASEEVTNWVHYANDIWMLPHWPIHSQQVFVNGQLLRMLGWPNRFFQDFPGRYEGAGNQGLADLAPGTFFYDPTNTTLYVWLADSGSPLDRKMEVSTRLGTINLSNMWGFTNKCYRVRNLDFLHASTCTFSSFGWPSVWLPAESVLEDCVVAWSDAGGISISHNSVVTNVALVFNGQLGGSAGTNFLFSHCVISSNNYRGFSSSWQASGLKFIPDVHGVVESCDVGWNRGPGLWWDFCLTGQPSAIRNNYIHHNFNNAVFIEVTKNVDISHNLFVSNAIRSIYLSSSEDVSVRHNTIAGHQSWMTVEFHYTPTRTNAMGQPYPLRNNRFVNNIVYRAQALRELILIEDDPPYCENNRSDYNAYYRGGGEFMAMNRLAAPALAFTTLAAWTQATGQDVHSLAADPLFVDPDGGDYHLASQGGAFHQGAWTTFPVSSPCIDTGDPHADFTREPFWNGGRVNIGRYGNTPEASRSIDKDQDGASDTLERAVLGTNPYAADTDGDRVHDHAEYVAGSDPLDPANVFRLALEPVPVSESFDLALSWYGVDGRRYRVWSAPEAGSGEWMRETQWVGSAGLLPDPIPGADALIELRLIEPRSVPARLYRLSVEWP